MSSTSPFFVHVLSKKCLVSASGGKIAREKANPLKNSAALGA
jgi:hypothetical protein